MKIKNLFLFFLLLLNGVTFGQNIDINLLKQINISRNKNLDNFNIFITNTATPLALGAPALGYFIGKFSFDSTLKKKSLISEITVISSLAITEIIKYTFNRQRPFQKYPFIKNIVSETGPSFPSGHTTEAFSFAASLSLNYPYWYVIAPSYLWASMVAYSRMDLGVHYPSDVLAGAIVGIGSAYVCFKLRNWIFNKIYK